MDRLLEELIADGMLDVASASFAQRHQLEQGGAVDTALLELDLIDEEGLLRGLQRCHEMKVATAADFDSISANVAGRFPYGFSKSFGLCPVRFAGNELVALVQRPLSQASRQELADLFGLHVRELLSPAHHLAVVTERVYEVPLPERHRALEERLARKRSAPALPDIIAKLGRMPSFAAAVDELLEFAARLIDFPCLCVLQGEELRVAFPRGPGPRAPGSIAVPGSGSSLAPAIVHGGYFFGPLSGSDADRRFYDSLGRAIPRCAFLAPIASARTKTTFFYADNGARGIAARWVAELSVAVGRLGQKSGARHKQPVPNAPTPEPGVVAATASAGITTDEQLVLARLRSAAAEAQMDLVRFVDDLLRPREASTLSEPSRSPLMDEVKVLFEKLATDLPANLARGMQAAFRDMTAQPFPPHADQSVRSSIESVALVRAPTPRTDAASYQTRRQKTARVKL